MDIEFYIINKIEQDVEVDGIHLLAGYYRMRYNLSGIDVPHCSQFSTDRCEWRDCELFTTFSEYKEFFDKIEPKPLVMERLEYIETIEYRGMCVPIFCDDYGQCFYCIFNNKEMSFGSFQSEYEDEVKWLIDHEIDCKKNNGK